jgi:hypothetical protein
MDGPVVSACKMALKTENVNYALPFVPKKAEEELSTAFNKTLKARESGADAALVADLWFFETAVRLHREEREQATLDLNQQDWTGDQ